MTEDPRMQYRPAGEKVTEAFRLKDHPEQNLAANLREIEVEFANVEFRHYLKTSPGNLTFADIFESTTPICAEIDRVDYTERNFTQEEFDAVNHAYEKNGTSGVVAYLDTIAPASMVFPNIEDESEVGIFRTDHVEVTQRTLNERMAQLYGRRIGEKVFEIFVFPAGRDANEEKRKQELTPPLLRELLREVAKHAEFRPDVTGAIGASWLFDLPLARKLGFQISTFGEGGDSFISLRRRSAWLQLVGANSRVQESRVKELFRTGGLPYNVRVGFMPRDVLLQEHGSSK